MANPKRRHSNCRTRLRRAHDHLKPRSITKCSNCGHFILPHHVCGYCGYYRGRQVVTIRAKTKEETGTAQ